MLPGQCTSSRVLQWTPAAWRRWFFGLSHLSPDVVAAGQEPDDPVVPVEQVQLIYH